MTREPSRSHIIAYSRNFSLHFQGTRADSDSAVTSSRQSADVGSVICNIKSVLELIDETVMLIPDCKRSVTQILNTLLSEKGTDASVLLCILDMLKRWVEDDFSKTSASGMSGSFLTQKDVVAFLSKLSYIDKQHFSSDALEEWDQKYLQLLYGLCADSTKYVYGFYNLFFPYVIVFYVRDNVIFI